MTTPLVSIIIPTYERSRLLPNAIRSALACAPDGNTEVIIVPNGSDTAWRSIASEFDANARVRWHHLAAAGVSAARNFGLEHARGTFIRFLDDDDYVLPAACQAQCNALVSNSADVCSGALAINRHDGTRIKTWRQPQTNDFCVATLTPERRTQVGCHLFRRNVIGDLRWNEGSSLNEDMEWLLTVAASTELKWIRTDDIVAAWIQHGQKRLSTGHDPGSATLKYSANVLVVAATTLEATGRLTPLRREAIADALWSLVQKGLRYDFQFWSAIAGAADGYVRGRRPPSRIHRTWPFSQTSPLVIETALIPIRDVYGPIRRVLDCFGVGRT